MRKIFYIVLALFFIFLWFYLVDFKKVIEIIPKINWSWIILSVFLGIITSFISSLRLRVLFSLIARIPTFFIWKMSYIAALVSMVFPFSAGGFAFAYFVSKKAKSSYKKTLAIVFTDFAIGIPFTFILGFFAIIFFSQKKLLQIGLESSIIFFLILLLVFIFFLLMIFLRFKLRFVHNLFFKIGEGIKLIIKSKNIFFKSIALTIVIMSIGTINFYLYFIAFGLYPPLIDFILAGSLLGILGLIPGAPMKIGQYETFGVLTLPYLLSLDKDIVFAILLIQRIISITTILAIGLVISYFFKFDFSVLRKLSKISREKN